MIRCDPVDLFAFDFFDSLLTSLISGLLISVGDPLDYRKAKRKKAGVAGVGMTTSFRRFDQFGTGGVGTSDHVPDFRSVVCWRTKLLEGMIQERRIFVSERAMVKRGCTTIWAV